MNLPEARLLGGDHDTIPFTLTADATCGEIIKLPDDRAAVVLGLNDTTALVSGDPAQVAVRGPVRIKKAAGVDLSGQQNIYWDVSANTAIATGSAATGDFIAGTRIGGGASAETFVDIDLNAGVGTETA